MSQSVEFIFDFGSPNAYLVHRALPAIAERTDASFTYLPCLLGGIFKSTNNQAPMLAFSHVKGKMEYERLEMQRFIAKHELTKFTFNAHFPVNTLILMRAAIAAEQGGFLTEYVEAGLKAMWEDSKNMADPEVFAQVMTEAGFDGAALLEATQDPAVKAKLAENTEAAVQRGVFGIPTLFVGDEMFFGKERLGQMEDQINASA